MSFTFTKQNILYYANKYDERYKRTEDFFIEKELRDWFSKHRYLTRDKFIKLGLWKSKRPKRHYKNFKNTDGFVKNLTSLAFEASNERERIELLLSTNNGLKGVSWPVASTILHFAFPNKYSIMDFRAIWSLGIEKPKKYDYQFWLDYCKKIKMFAIKFKQSIRTIDKALWQYSKENQKK